MYDLFALLSRFDLFQVLAEMKSLQCQVGWRFHFGLVGAGHNLAVQPAHQRRALHPGPSARCFWRFPVSCFSETRLFLFGVVLRPSGYFCFGARVVFVRVFWCRFFFSAVFSSACCVVLRSCIFSGVPFGLFLSLALPLLLSFLLVICLQEQAPCTCSLDD